MDFSLSYFCTILCFFHISSQKKYNLIIVFISLIPIPNNSSYLLLRLLRVFRVLRLISVIPELKKIIEKAVPKKFRLPENVSKVRNFLENNNIKFNEYI
mgnify:CR=1 FL=1